MAEKAAVLFVHGTGVRQPRLELLFDEVKQMLAAHCSHLEPKVCFWGDLGVPAGLLPKSVPMSGKDANRVQAQINEDEAQRQASEWRLLYLDPFFELRSLVGAPPPAIAGRRTPGQLFELHLAESELPARLASAIAKLGFLDPAVQWRSAVATLQRSSEFSGVEGTRRTMPDPGIGHRRAVAKCLVALLAIAADEIGYSACDGAIRDELLREVNNHLESTVLGAASAAKTLSWPLRRAGEWWVRSHRGTLAASAVDFVGDILVYQTRGAAISNRLRASVSGTPAVIAHSLGGVAMVDLLVESLRGGGDALGVEKLITVGSQAAYLYEIGALRSLERNETLPDGFPEWLNIYDCSDLLSFRVEEIIDRPTGLQPVTRDFEVDTGQPFPESHSAYFRHKRVWERIGEFTSQ